MIRQDRSVQKLIQEEFRKLSQITILLGPQQPTLHLHTQVENQKSTQKDLQATTEAVMPKKLMFRAKNRKGHSCWDQGEVARSFQQHKNLIRILQMEVQNDILSVFSIFNV